MTTIPVRAETLSSPAAPVLLPVERPRPPNPDRDVYVVSQKSRRGRMCPPKDLARLVNPLRPPAFFMVGLAMLITSFVVGTITRAAGLKLGIALDIVVALAALVAGLTVRQLRIRRRGARPDLRGNASEDSAYRLRCWGHSRDCGAVAPLNDDPFEPQIYFVPFQLPVRRVWGVLFWIAVSTVFCLILVVGRNKGVIPRGITHSGPLDTFDTWACMALASFVLMPAFPTYYRVSPGRVDIIRYGFFGMGGGRTESFDLRRARLLVNVTGADFILQLPGQPPAYCGYSSWLGSMPELARYLFQAARWQGDHLPLSEDGSLVG